jgi:hypothetical protein
MKLSVVLHYSGIFQCSLITDGSFEILNEAQAPISDDELPDLSE